MSNSNKRFAFTYIELLIVVVLILAVSTVSAVAWKSATTRARDTKRKSDLQQYHVALQNYGSRTEVLGAFGVYPRVTQTSLADSLCATPTPQLSEVFIKNCPQDRKSALEPAYGYYYSSSTGSTAGDYVLYTKLEGKDVYWVYCSNNKSGEVPASIVINAGVCPLP